MSDADLDLGPILNIAHRLSPIIIISFFLLSTAFNGLANGILCFTGMLICVGIVGACGAGFAQNMPHLVSKNRQCFVINLTGKNKYWSMAPINLAILCYTFVYLIYPVIRYDLVPAYLPTIIFFPILILAEIGWLWKNECVPFSMILFTIVATMLITPIFAAMVDNLGAPIRETGIRHMYSIGDLNKKCVPYQYPKDEARGKRDYNAGIDM